MGLAGGGEWPHRSSREAGAARIPQLLRRMLFRVEGGCGGAESNGGRKGPRAKRGLESCAGGGLRWPRCGGSERAGALPVSPCGGDWLDGWL